MYDGMGLIISLHSSSVNPGNFRNAPAIYDRLNVVLRTKVRDTPFRHLCIPKSITYSTRTSNSVTLHFTNISSATCLLRY